MMKIVVNPVLKMIMVAFCLVGLSTLSACASVDADTEITRNIEVNQAAISTGEPNLNTIVSRNEFEDTLTRAVAAIDKRGFKTFAVIDHAKGARSIDQDLRPTTLIIFGNPVGGTPLMQSAQTIGIELPLKMLVHRDEAGTTHVSWPKMDIVFQEYGVTDRDVVLAKIQGALQAIANEAVTNEG